MNAYQTILSKIGKAKLVAVTKGKAVEDILSLYNQGQRFFGEARVQEILNKIETCPKDCLWHFIGRLQKNKVSKIIGKCALIHSVDSLELAQKIDSESQKQNLITSILLQINISGEVSKQGMSLEDLFNSYESLRQLTHIQVKGFMTMAPLTEDKDLIRKCFKDLKDLQVKINARFSHFSSIHELSMGMSNDYEVALEEGATLIRLGRALFSSF